MKIFVILVAVRLYCLYVSLALVLPWCGASSQSQNATTTESPGQKTPTSVPPGPPVPVGPLICHLLDTTAGSAPAADARPNLQAGPEVRAFYGAACAPAWVAPAHRLTADAGAAMQLLGHAAEYGLPADYVSARLLELRDSLQLSGTPGRQAQQEAQFDIGLSDAVLRFMRDLHRGRLRPYAEPARAKKARARWLPAVVLRAALDQGEGQVPAAMLAGQLANREYRQLERALAQWLAQPVPPDSAAQHRARYEQAAVNLERWRWEAWPPDSEYVFINLPAYELLVVAHDSVMRRHRVIIGKPATPTPTLSSTIRYFTLAPDWHLPRSIATKEILPHLKKDPGYLALNNLSLYDAEGRGLDPYAVNWATVTPQNFSYTIQQSAGCDNALGNVVFRFANPYSVYLHDTPTRQYFEQPNRAASHGCIRLAEPLQLAAYLLRRDGRPVRLPSESECAHQPRPHDVRLVRTMPLHVGYATCTAENGQLRFFADVYGRDKAVRRALFGAKLVEPGL